jgi:hypothetical protein
MNKFRFWCIGLISFFTIISETFWQRFIAVSLCGVLGTASACYLVSDGRVNAALPIIAGGKIAQVDLFTNQEGNTTNPNHDIFSNPTLQISPQPPQTINNQPTSSSNDTENAEPICTCWFSEEQPAGKVWDCRLWGKLNGWGWWWFHPHGGRPSLIPPDEVQNGKCKVTNGQKELEEQRLNINNPPRGIKP